MSSKPCTRSKAAAPWAIELAEFIERRTTVGPRAITTTNPIAKGASVRVHNEVSLPAPAIAHQVKLPEDPQKRFAALKKLFEGSRGKHGEKITEQDFVGWRAGHILFDQTSPPTLIPKVLIAERRGTALRIAALHDDKAARATPTYFETMTAAKAAPLRATVDAMFRTGSNPVVSAEEIYFCEKPGIQHRLRKVGQALVFKVEYRGVTGYGIFENVVTPKPPVVRTIAGDSVITIKFER